MSVIIFGNGPLLVDKDLPVMAPGSRTWQIVRMAADALSAAGLTAAVTVVCLYESTTSDTRETTFFVQTTNGEVPVRRLTLPYQEYVSYADKPLQELDPTGSARCVIGTGSVQPYSTAARFAARNSLPLWIDVFGDPICEYQSQAEILPDDEETEKRLVHTWKLLTDGLLNGDRFSALSTRQRHALLGQLGCVGRLNQRTVTPDLVEYLPYAIFEDDLSTETRELDSDLFTVMWCGSFNTWMDVPTLVSGLATALRSNPRMRLLVVGGRVEGYNEVSYNQFLQGIREAGVEGSITLMDWQPLQAMARLYARSDLGLSIDRFTYEAELGSRTRLVNFLAAGVPVASTRVTELSDQLYEAGLLLPFELGNAGNLVEALNTAADQAHERIALRQKARAFVLENFDGRSVGSGLRNWIPNAVLAGDKMSTEPSTNLLMPHIQKLRESLGA